MIGGYISEDTRGRRLHFDWFRIVLLDWRNEVDEYFGRLPGLQVCLGLRPGNHDGNQVHKKIQHCIVKVWAAMSVWLGACKNGQAGGPAALSPGRPKKTPKNLLERRVASEKVSKKCTTITACKDCLSFRKRQLT